MDYDHSKYVAFELSMEEIALIRELLKFETLFQASRDIKAYDQNNLEGVLTKVFTIFEGHRTYDDILKDLYFILSATEGVDDKKQNFVLISKQAAALFKLICIDTPKLTLPVNLREKSDKMAEFIANRIEAALTEHDLAFENNPDDLKINILGTPGLA